MNKIYRQSNTLHPVLQCLIAFVIGALYWFCCLPSFRLIGHFGAQVFWAVLLSLLCTALLFLIIPRSLTVLGKGLSVFLLSVLAKALYDQIIVQIQAGQLSLWQYTFFYDKPMTVAFVWGVAYVSLMLLRLFLPLKDSPDHFVADYARFFRDSTGVFLFFYICFLIYCFILQRSPGGDGGVNLVPFAMITEYIRAASYLYETSFYLLGNILCFFPFGFFVRVYRVRFDMFRIILIPIVISVLIEVTQLLLHMGHFDIDDIIMNASGFYFGYFLSFLLDWARSRITSGEEQTIFVRSAHN